jgi:pantothenate kinase
LTPHANQTAQGSNEPLAADPDALADIARTLAAAQPGRVLIGLAGPPGVGKSTLSETIAKRLGSAAALAPLDGFHLSTGVVPSTDMLDRRGAIDTFDGWGYLALLERLLHHSDRDIYLPSYSRELDEPIAAALVIPANARIVITEGNYLLVEEPPWGFITQLLTESWYLDAPDDDRLRRLTARHARYGKTPAEAEAWATTTDHQNAKLIAASRHRATRRLLYAERT